MKHRNLSHNALSKDCMFLHRQFIVTFIGISLGLCINMLLRRIMLFACFCTKNVFNVCIYFYYICVINFLYIIHFVANECVHDPAWWWV